MHVTLVAIAAVGAAALALAAGVHRYRNARRQRRWELRWQRFLASQPGLDSELDGLWRPLER